MRRLLIQAGYDVNIKDNDGWTPLHAAAHWGKEEACRILVENLCDMDLVNKMVSNYKNEGKPVKKCDAVVNFLFDFIFSSPQGQTAFDVADEDVLGYLEELQKKQNLVSLNPDWTTHSISLIELLRYLCSCLLLFVFVFCFHFISADEWEERR